MRTPTMLASLAALTAVLAGCNSPTVADNATETFSGTVQPSQADAMKTFSVGATGEVIATLESLTPGALVAVFFGQPSGSTCVGTVFRPIAPT